MSDNRIEPHRIKQPIQLLAAWLVALIVLVAAFLTGAANIEAPNWAPVVLVVSAVACVPIFLGFVFLMQTKFRVEMQDDQYYSEQIKIKLAQKSDDFKRLMGEAGLGADAIISGKSMRDIDPKKREELLAEMKGFEDPILRLEATNSFRSNADPDVILQFGKALLANREWKRAGTYLDSYVIKKPSDWNGHFLRGVAHANTEGGEDADLAALTAYSNAILTAPDDLDQNRLARFLSYRAAMLKRLRKLDEALIDLRKAEKLGSNYYEANDISYNLACVYALQGDRERLLSTIKRLKGSAPDLARITKHKDDYFAKFANDPEFLAALGS